MSSGIIHFGIVSNKFIYPVISTFILVLHSLFYTFSGRYTSDGSIFNVFMMFFAESLSLIVFFIQSKFINSKEKQEIKNNTQKSTLTIICLICLCSSLDLCNTFIDNSIVIILMDNLLYNISEIIFALFIIGFSKIILGIQLHHHHLFGIFFFFAGMILNSIINIRSNINVSSLILPLVGKAAFAIQIVLEKYLLEHVYVNEYLLLGGEGVFGVIVTTILLIFGFKRCGDYSIDCNFQKFITDIKNAGYFYIPTTIVYFILVFLLNIFRLLTIYHYIPAYHFIPTQFRAFILWIIQMIIFKDEVIKFSYFTLGGYILEIIGILILLEIVIIKVFGMDKNVEIEIIKRQNEDLLENVRLYSLEEDG